jgi:uncharacterized membrane protein
VLPGIGLSEAFGINDAGQVVGVEYSAAGTHGYAAEWSGGSVIALGSGLANSINDAGQAVGVGSLNTATEWSGGSVINLANLPGIIASTAYDINDAGLVVGSSFIEGALYATEWSGQQRHRPRRPAGLHTSSEGRGINDVGQVVGDSGFPPPPPSVPEPSTWAMMLFGFASLAFGYRRAKTRLAISQER